MRTGGVVTLTSSAQGAICPGEEVTLTCTVTGGVGLEWSSVAFNPTIRYAVNEPVGTMRERGIFTATLTSVISTPTLSLISTLRVTEAPEAMLNGTVITCTELTNLLSATLNLTLAGKYNNMMSCV